MSTKSSTNTPNHSRLLSLTEQSVYMYAAMYMSSAVSFSAPGAVKAGRLFSVLSSIFFTSVVDELKDVPRLAFQLMAERHER